MITVSIFIHYINLKIIVDIWIVLWCNNDIWICFRARMMIINSINIFLNQQIEIEFTKEQCKNPTASEKKLVSIKTNLLAEYEFSNWMKNTFESLNVVQKEGISLATHLAKGIHSSSKSSNLIIQKPKDGTDCAFVNSNTVLALPIDANNSNTATFITPLNYIVNFLNIFADEKRFYQLIIQNNEQMREFFKKYLDLTSFDFLRNLLSTNIESPKISDRDKQILFPISDNNYITLFPIYPSSLAHEVFKQINHIKYQEKHSQIVDLAFVRLGGTKPLNVGVLNNKQGGRNYLLPSLPPKFKGSDSIRIAPYAQSIFESKSIEYYAKDDLQAVFEVIQDMGKGVDIRDKRKLAIDKMIACIFEIAMDIQQNRIAGWSKEKEYENLPMFEKYWLDPNRSELDGEEDFKHARENEDWHNDIAQRFSNWLQKTLKNKFPEIKQDFGEPEYYEWFREMQTEIKKAIRLGTGVF